MQMRKSYETTNKPMRIAALKQSATECERKGFTLMAELNREQAALLQSEVDAAARAAEEAKEDE